MPIYREKKMSHYFTNDPNLESHERVIKFSVNSLDLQLISDSGVFSNKSIDTGTLIFIKYLSSINLKGKILDLGCGYGPIGITLKLLFKDLVSVDFIDINPKCVELTSRNLKYYDLDGKCSTSDGYLNDGEKYDYILFNPPISIGKERIFKIYSDTVDKLTSNGHFYLVIRKDKGALSHLKYLSSLFEASVIYKEKGYFIIECINKE